MLMKNLRKKKKGNEWEFGGKDKMKIRDEQNIFTKTPKVEMRDLNEDG